MIIDIHCHYTFTRRQAQPGERFSFEPAEENGRVALDSFVAPRKLRRPAWRLAKRFFGIDPRLPPGPGFDTRLAELYHPHLFNTGPVDRIVLLALDAYHDDDGQRVPPPETRRQPGSDIYTSNSLVLQTCREHPQRFLFGASVHPYRENATACIEEVFTRGACLLKWLPLHQNIDISDPRTLAVLRCCARLGLPVLAHYGEEFMLTTHRAEFRSVAPLLDVLRQLRREHAMPTTIVAHIATPATPFGERRSHALLLNALLGEFARAPLFADISAFTSWGKAGYLRRTARRQALHPKLLFGSDFPVPLALPRLRRTRPHEHADARAQRSWIQQAVRIYRNAGYNEIIFHHAAQLLPHVDHFSHPPAGDGPPA